MSLESMRQAYGAIAKIDAPNPMQQAVWDVFERDDAYGIAVLLKGGTGSGKTEAVALPALWMRRRLIMIYPTRSLVDDQTGRFRRYLEAWSALPANMDRVVTLTVDTGAQSQRYCWQNGRVRPTGEERASRHLYYGDVIITTLDKFLYRFFGFGEPKKSYIYPLRIRHMRNPLICFDEVHSYERETFTNFERLVRTLVEKGKDVALMTATMPPDLEKLFTPYLATLDFVTGAGERQMAEWRKALPRRPLYPGKRLRYISADSRQPEGARYSPLVERMIQEAEQASVANRRLIVTAETVRDAAAIYQRLEQTIRGVPLRLYHGRLTQSQRHKVYQELKQRDENKQGYVLVSTSAIEVGCDLDAHLLITQLCDPDRLIQRAGRCNRREGMHDATIIVVGDDIPQWASALPPDARAAYIDALRANDGQPFKGSDFIAHIQKRLEPDPRVAVMFDMLYEYVYEAQLENKKLHDNGLVITRSWEPSITLYQGEDGGRLLEPVSVPISSCRIPQDQQPTPLLNGGIYKQTYDPKDQRFKMMPLGNRWENAYHNDIVVCCPEYTYTDGSPYRPELGYVDLPFLFRGPFPRGARVIVEHGADGEKATIWYIDPKRVTEKPFEGVAAPATPPDESDEESAPEEGEE